MTQVLTSFYDSYDEAKRTVGNLEAAGIPGSDISIIASRADDPHSSGAASGAGVGLIAGGGAGLLAGLGVMAIPGIGPVVAAGWLAATLVGAAAGAAGGGLIGALVSAGASEEKDAHVYAEGIRRGGNLVSVRVDDAQANTASMILQHHRPVDVVRRRALYEKEGWRQFDPEAIPYTPPQVMGQSDTIPRK